MIKLSTIEKNLILSAIQFEKDTLSENEYEQENLEDVHVIIHELESQDSTLSRRQFDLIIEYLGVLHYKKNDCDHVKVLELENKLKDWEE